MKAGKDYIGVGVGAIVFNDKGEVFLSQRGEQAKNERGTWEFPGGSVEFGDTLHETVKREFMEEYGIGIEIFSLLAVDDHILPDEGQHWVLRHFMRGGLVGKILSDQYFFNGIERSRPFEEFRLLEYMRGEGLLVPIPVAARIHRRGLIYRGDIITLNIPNSQDLHHFLCQQPLSKGGWNEVGRALARMHNCQVYHHDANVRNIMIDSEKQIWIIDFDRCSKRQGNSWKQNNLDRLLRSLHKEQAKNKVFHWKEDDWTACLDGYNELVKR